MVLPQCDPTTQEDSKAKHNKVPAKLVNLNPWMSILTCTLDVLWWPARRQTDRGKDGNQHEHVEVEKHVLHSAFPGELGLNNQEVNLRLDREQAQRCTRMFDE